MVVVVADYLGQRAVCFKHYLDLLIEVSLWRMLYWVAVVADYLSQRAVCFKRYLDLLIEVSLWRMLY